MMNSKLMSWVTAAVCATALTGLARADDIEAVTKVVQRMLPGMTPDHVIESPVPGLYEVGLGPEVLYVNLDGRFAVQGDLINLANKENKHNNKKKHNKKHRNKNNKQHNKKHKEKDKIVFPASAGKTRHTITVF